MIQAFIYKRLISDSTHENFMTFPFSLYFFFGGLCDLCSDSRAQFNCVLLTLSPFLSLHWRSLRIARVQFYHFVM